MTFSDRALAQAVSVPQVTQFSQGPAFSGIAFNMIESIRFLPGLLSGLAYMFGTMLGAQAIIKIKDHVEQPHNIPLKDGLGRIVAGGALFALPIVFEAMHATIGANGAGVSAAFLSQVDFAVAP